MSPSDLAHSVENLLVSLQRAIGPIEDRMIADVRALFTKHTEAAAGSGAPVVLPLTDAEISAWRETARASAAQTAAPAADVTAAPSAS